MSNVFINAIRRVGPALRVTSDAIILFKFMRAPYGYCKFWRSNIRAVRLILNQAPGHELLDDLMVAIAEDMGVSAELFATSRPFFIQA